MLVRSADIQPVQVGTGATVLYTCPAQFRGTVRQLSVTNVNAAARTVTVYRVPSGSSPGAANTIVSALSVPPSGVNGGALSLAYLVAGQVLAPGDTLQALASAGASLNLSGGVVEETL
jgi:predicted phage tail protein